MAQNNSLNSNAILMKSRKFIQNFTAIHSDCYRWDGGSQRNKTKVTQKDRREEACPTQLKKERERQSCHSSDVNLFFNFFILLATFLKYDSFPVTNACSITMTKTSPAHKSFKQSAADGAKTTSQSWNALLLTLEDQRLRMMTSRFSACVLALLHFCCSSDSYERSTLPDIGDPKFIEECVTTHNRFRSGVNPPASNMLYMVRGS